MPASAAVTRSTLRQQIAEALRDEVLAGRLQPGQEFTVKEIAATYEVSATPVREALVDLTAQGLLDSIQHRGFQVHRFSVADFRGMVEARSLIVDGIFRQDGAPRVGLGRALGSVQRRAEEAARAARAADVDILIGYDVRFWRELGALVSNAYIADFLHRLRVQAWVFAVPHLRAESDLRTWLWSGHDELAEAIGGGDAGAARELIMAHNRHALAWADRLERRAGHSLQHRPPDGLELRAPHPREPREQGPQ
ncbi:GntR family transcriptional regulator [Streptomyces sp. NPDC019396]|uniref:GntR family transcriptional regulator n=1 Tax=Streptomyces sp. NPDC019396 TaxID=3154687 RepID=UPI0033D9E5CA